MGLRVMVLTQPGTYARVFYAFLFPLFLPLVYLEKEYFQYVEIEIGSD